MTGTTVTTYITTGIKIGYNGITSPLTILSPGGVTNKNPGGTGIYQNASEANAYIFLDGALVTGGSGISLAGGSAIIMKATGTLINGGEISGGYGGGVGGDKGSGLIGGDGVELLAAVTASTNGFIFGGQGGGGYSYGGIGGVGVLLGAANASLSNSDVIYGGRGGGSYYDGGDGGDGVDITAAASFSNSRYVTGGYGGTILKGYYAGTGGTGVALSAGGKFSNSGSISGGLGGGVSRYGKDSGAGGIGVSLYNATGSSTGTITGGTSGKFSDPGAGFTGGYAGTGGVGVQLSGKSSFANAGTIAGGAGAYGKAESGGGGAGIELFTGATASNTGTIFGGVGGAAGTAGKYAGRGNDAVFIRSGSLTNSGLIEAGTGGAGPTGGRGGYGAVVIYGLLKNTGTIIGGAGGAGSQTEGHLGIGGGGGGAVYLDGGVFTNDGTVTAGYGGVGSSNGTIGKAVLFGDLVGTLVADSGARFNGQVVANASYADVLEVAGTGKTALTGIGTQFTNFNNISFATGAAREIKGDIAGLATNQTITGFTAGDSIVLDGLQENQLAFDNGKSISLINGSTSATIDTAIGEVGVLLIKAGGGNSTLSLEKTLSKVNLNSFAYVYTNASATNITVTNGGVLLGDGTLKNTLVKKGGYEGVTQDGLATNTTLDAGGELAINYGGKVTGTIKMIGKDNQIQIGGPAAPGAVISGFVASDFIIFDELTAATGTAVVKKAGIVTVSAGGKSYNVKIAGAVVGSKAFHYADQVLTEKATAAPAMEFLRPVAGHAAQPMADFVPLAMHHEPAAIPAAFPASALPAHGGIFDFTQIPHGGIQVMPTLQSG